MGERLRVVRKDMRRTDWTRITARRYAFGQAQFLGFSGPTALIALDAVSDPFSAGGVLLADAGFTWFEFAPGGAHWWLTAMFDPAGAFVQAYVDVTLTNHLCPDGNSWFEDLFADLVVRADRSILLLDLDELNLAYRQGVIGAAQRALALQTVRDLRQLFSDFPEALPDFCARQREALLPLLPSLPGS